MTKLDPLNLTGAQIDTLLCLVEHGPLEPGDMPARSATLELIEAGWCVPIVVKGEDGFYAATYAGRNAYAAYHKADNMRDVIRRKREEKELVEKKARELYSAEVSKAGIHENRMPGWNELKVEQKIDYRREARRILGMR